MSDTITITTLEQLKQFLNEKNVLEIAVRGKHKRFKAFQKVMLSDVAQGQEKEILEKVAKALNKYTIANEKSLRLISNVANIGKIGLLLNGLNLCATCAGFAIMYAKLDSMSKEITRQIQQVEDTVKKGHDLQTGYEYSKVLSEHTDMLDCRRKQQPYSEEKMRILVDHEHDLLSFLIDAFEKDTSADHKELVFAIFSLLSMLTVSLMYFDEIYYDNNHDVLEDGVWHLSHEKWMAVYKRIFSKRFVEKLQDYALFETGLNTLGADVFLNDLLDQVASDRQSVEDNQALIIALGDIGLLHMLQEGTTQEIKEAIKQTFDSECAGDDREAVKAAYESALKQAGAA